MLSGANSLHWAALNSKRTSSFWQTPGETHVRPRKAKLHSLGTFHSFSSLFFPDWTSNKSHHIYLNLFRSLYMYIYIYQCNEIVQYYQCIFHSPSTESLTFLSFGALVAAWRTPRILLQFAFHEFHAFALLLFFEGPLFFSVKVFLGFAACSEGCKAMNKKENGKDGDANVNQKNQVANFEKDFTSSFVTALSSATCRRSSSFLADACRLAIGRFEVGLENLAFLRAFWPSLLDLPPVFVSRINSHNRPTYIVRSWTPVRSLKRPASPASRHGIVFFSTTFGNFTHTLWKSMHLISRLWSFKRSLALPEKIWKSQHETLCLRAKKAHCHSCRWGPRANDSKLSRLWINIWRSKVQTAWDSEMSQSQFNIIKHPSRRPQKKPKNSFLSRPQPTSTIWDLQVDQRVWYHMNVTWAKVPTPPMVVVTSQSPKGSSSWNSKQDLNLALNHISPPSKFMKGQQIGFPSAKFDPFFEWSCHHNPTRSPTNSQPNRQSSAVNATVTGTWNKSVANVWNDVLRGYTSLTSGTLQRFNQHFNHLPPFAAKKHFASSSRSFSVLRSPNHCTFKHESWDTSFQNF